MKEENESLRMRGTRGKEQEKPWLHGSKVREMLVGE